MHQPGHPGPVGSSPVYDPSAPTGGGPSTNMAAGSPAYGVQTVAPIFVGYERTRAAQVPSDPQERKLFGDPLRTSGGKTPILLTRTQLLSAFDQFSRKDYLRFRNLFIAAGLVSPEADAPTVRSAYASLLGEAEDMQAGGAMVSPMTLVKNLIRMNGLDPKKIGADEDYMKAVTDSAKPQSQSTTTVYDLAPEDAKSILEQAIEQKLGRAPTPEEVEDFIAAAQTRAENNPTRVTQKFIPGQAGGEGDEVTVQREGGQVVGTTVTNVNEGFDEADVARMAEETAEAAPDYASYQAVSQYFPALVQALGSTV